jgi:AcrR family transcriptional regulator
MSASVRTQRADSAETRTRILNASEQLFSERGYSGTSLRAIAEQAGVNVASANYHFGSKARLLEAALQRAVGPINSERLQRLDQLQSSSQPPILADIVRAFIEPVISKPRSEGLPRLLARVFAEPSAIAVPLLEHTFRPVAARFLAALEQALPGVSAEDLSWRFQFVIGAMVHMARFHELPAMFRNGDATAADAPASQIEKLIAFAVAGLQQSPEPDTCA